LARKRQKSNTKAGSRAAAAPKLAARRLESTLLSKRVIRMVIALALTSLVASGLASLLNTSGPVSNAQNYSVATFVGSQICTGCHQAEAKLWNTSQHKVAMQHVTDKTVLGNFNDASFDHYGVHSRFFRKDRKFLVETDGPDGQRWFHIFPNEEIKHDDVLHWTKLNQNWNFMCAECHSTGVRRNYDAKADRFATSWQEISVGCEACHDQGSRHTAWAREQRSWWSFGKREDPSRRLSFGNGEGYGPGSQGL